MKIRTAALAALLGLLALGIPQVAQAELKRAVLTVKGMVCSSWPISVATALERLPGVKRADVRLETEEARVVYDDARQTPEKLAAAIDRLGFQASILSVTAAPKPTLVVDRLGDLKAVRKVEAVLRGFKGVRGVSVDPGTGEVFVEYDGEAVSPQQLAGALQAAGFSARPAPVPWSLLRVCPVTGAWSSLWARKGRISAQVSSAMKASTASKTAVRLIKSTRIKFLSSS